MATNVDNVNIAVTGRISIGSDAAQAPTDAESPLGTGWSDLGYADENGVEQTIDRTVDKVKAWQNADTVREVVSEASASFKFTLIETKKETVELYYGTTVDQDGALVVIPSQLGPKQKLCIDVIDGEDVIRLYTSKGQVTEVGAVVYKNGDPIGYEITVTAYPDAALGGAFKKWIAKLAPTD